MGVLWTESSEIGVEAYGPHRSKAGVERNPLHRRLLSGSEALRKRACLGEEQHRDWRVAVLLLFLHGIAANGGSS